MGMMVALVRCGRSFALLDRQKNVYKHNPYGGEKIMIDVRILLAALWIAVEFLYQQGDMQRIYSGDFKPGEVELGGVMSPETLWMISAVTMTIPVAMIILSLILPHNANRWANIIVAAFFFLYTIIGVGKYPSAYDRFLLIVSLVANALTMWYAWKWI
jgi:hypothetical protein